MAVVILASPKTWTHSPKERFVVIMWNWGNSQHFLQSSQLCLIGVGVVSRRSRSRSIAAISPSMAARSSSVSGIS